MQLLLFAHRRRCSLDSASDWLHPQPLRTIIIAGRADIVINVHLLIKPCVCVLHGQVSYLLHLRIPGATYLSQNNVLLPKAALRYRLILPPRSRSLLFVLYVVLLLLFRSPPEQSAAATGSTARYRRHLGSEGCREDGARSTVRSVRIP